MKKISDILKQQIAGKKSPSVSYSFFDRDSVIYSNAEGVKNVKSGMPVDSNTNYNIFSITKTFTALLILQLVQKGKVSLSAPAVKYLSHFPYGEKITVEQLLTHTSGIPNPMPMQWIHLISEDQSFDRDLFFGNIFKKNPRLDFAPGTRFKYSNLGYVLLGQLIESITGQDYESCVVHDIIEKAGIAASSLGFTIRESDHATGYQKSLSVGNVLLSFLIDRKKFMYSSENGWSPFRNFYVNGISYGGLVGSIAGLTKYAQVLMRKDSLLLDETHKEILFRENVIGNKPTGMSHAWFKGTLKGHVYAAHAGGGGGYYSELRIYPDLEVGSVIMFNRSGFTDERFLDKMDGYFLS